MASTPPVSPLVSTQWLKNKLDERAAGNTQDDLIVIDATVIFTLSGHRMFLKSRIPTARHYDFLDGLPATALRPTPVPTAPTFQEAARRLGVNSTSHVVFYDRDDGDIISTMASARAWWLFRLYGHENVSVLDGGLNQWIRDGFPTQSGPEDTVQVTRGNLVAQPQEDLLVEFEQMQQIVKSRSHQILDTRLPDNFSGSEPEPSDFTCLALEDRKLPALKPGTMATGSMQGSCNIPYPKFLNDKHPLYPTKEEGLALFKEAGVRMDVPMVTTCYIGFSACGLALMASICGQHRVPVYVGSWTEWGQKVAEKGHSAL